MPDQRFSPTSWISHLLSFFGLLSLGIGAYVSMKADIADVKATIRITNIEGLPKDMAEVKANQQAGALWRAEMDRKMDRLLSRVGDD